MTAKWKARDWQVLSALLFLALAVRVIFYTGYFGSDEVTYATSALKAARGEPLTDVYIGAIRLGVNYPMAAFVSLFGVSEASLAAYGMLCSVAEVALVFIFAHALAGLGLAAISALILALVPMHIHLAGRIMADSPLGLFITATFVAFFFGERTGRTGWYVLAGVCAGAVFWVKQPTVIFLLAFIPWVFIRRRIDPKWGWAVAAFVGVVALNFLETWRASGNPWLLRDSLALAGEHTAKFPSWTSPWFYFRYLFLDMRHTALLGWLALAGAVVAVLRAHARDASAPGAQYLLLWGGGLLAMFSLFVAQIDPLRLIPKQSNYMTIFLAPLAVLAGLAILSVRSVLSRGLIIAVYVGLGLLLAGLQQQSIRAFTANSRATVTYAAEHPDKTVHAMTNAYRLRLWLELLGDTPTASNIRDLGDLAPRGTGQWVVVDPETLGWGATDPDSVDELPRCWVPAGRLRPEMASTAGLMVVRAVASIAGLLPGTVAGRVDSVLRPLYAPEAATLYRVPAGCRSGHESAVDGDDKT